MIQSVIVVSLIIILGILIIISYNSRKDMEKAVDVINSNVSKFKQTTGYTEFNPKVYQLEEELCEIMGITYEQYKDIQKKRMT